MSNGNGKADAWLKDHGHSTGEDQLQKELDKYTKNLADLQHKVFPPLRFAVPELIPEGLTLFAGKPKVGKSFMCLDMALAVAMGGICLGKKCEPGDVYALSLEDTDRRLQTRITRMIGAQKEDWPPRFKYATQFPKLNEGGLDLLYQWARKAEHPRLLSIDLWEAFRSPQTNGNKYSSDYADLALVQKTFSEFPGLAVIVTNHQRKAMADDIFDTISGTLGLNGGADTLLVLARQEGTKALEARGRDIGDYAIVVQQDDNWRWINVGSMQRGASTPERRRIIDVLKGKGPMSVANIAKSLGITNGSSQYDSLKALLYKMHVDEVLQRAGKWGSYVYPEGGDNVH